jgi:hypothetical protein
MSVCGKYVIHNWTRALRSRDKVCVRCGLPFSDRRKTPLQQLPPSLSNAKTPKNKISPLKQVAVKRLSGHRFTAK